MRLWAFPQVMSEPVRWQYLPNGTAAHFQFAALLHTAKWLRSISLVEEAIPGFWEQNGYAVEAWIGASNGRRDAPVD